MQQRIRTRIVLLGAVSALSFYLVRPVLDVFRVRQTLLGTWKLVGAEHTVTYKKGGVVEVYFQNPDKVRGVLDEWYHPPLKYGNLVGSYRFVDKYKIEELIDGYKNEDGKILPYPDVNLPDGVRLNVENNKTICEISLGADGNSFCYVSPDTKAKGSCYQRVEDREQNKNDGT